MNIGNKGTTGREPCRLILKESRWQGRRVAVFGVLLTSFSQCITKKEQRALGTHECTPASIPCPKTTESRCECLVVHSRMHTKTQLCTLAHPASI